jgi:hypothetical protein
MLVTGLIHETKVKSEGTNRRRPELNLVKPVAT